MSKTALITGITGQDGSYLAELLLQKGYRVVGMTRRTSTEVHERIAHLVDDIEFVSGDLLDQSSMTGIVAVVKPDEIYNLAAQSFVPASWALATGRGRCARPVCAGTIGRARRRFLAARRRFRFRCRVSSGRFRSQEGAGSGRDRKYLHRQPDRHA
jgi:NAD(P)-dependent dehydrogenase (short-subunit alcohol dehydrogenase family)